LNFLIFLILQVNEQEKLRKKGRRTRIGSLELLNFVVFPRKELSGRKGFLRRGLEPFL